MHRFAIPLLAAFLTAPALAADIFGVPEVAAGKEQLAQLKTKGITKANAELIGALSSASPR